MSQLFREYISIYVGESKLVGVEYSNFELEGVRRVIQMLEKFEDTFIFNVRGSR